MTSHRIGAPGSIARHASNYAWPAGHTHAAYVYRGAVAELLASGSKAEAAAAAGKVEGALVVEVASYAAAALAEAAGQKLDRREVADSWRFGTVYRWSPPTGRFCETLEAESIKPGESLAAAERAANGFIVIVDA